MVLRRPLTGELLLTGTDADQSQFDFRESEGPTKRYEYAVLGTSTRYGSLALAQLYRDRADAEHTFDELKNQWGWGGFTTQELTRCQLMARMVALIDNWWTRFVRLTQPHKHFEAISSRPLLLHGVATQTHHAGPHAPDYHQPAREALSQPSRADELGGLSAHPHTHCGPVD